MLLKNNGVIMAELLLSLACILMLSLFFIPLIIDIKIQVRNLLIEKQATLLLYEELQTSIVNPLSIQNHSIVINRIEYKIAVNGLSETGQKEVCVKVERNHSIAEKNICHIFEY